MCEVKERRQRKKSCHYEFTLWTSVRHYLYHIDARVLHNIALFCIRALCAEICQRAQIEDMQNGKYQQSQRLRERPLKALSEWIFQLSECGESTHYIMEYTDYHWFKSLMASWIISPLSHYVHLQKKTWRWKRTNAYLQCSVHSFKLKPTNSRFIFICYTDVSSGYAQPCSHLVVWQLQQ